MASLKWGLPNPPRPTASQTIAGGASIQTPDVNNAVPHILWSGASGTRYRLELYPIGTAFYEKPGVYIFCNQLPNGDWRALYVGESHNMRSRLTDDLLRHDAYPGVVRLGGTHICAAVVTGTLQKRLDIETDLRRFLDPPLNRQ
jgi:hypothetical protein